jgi:hypothetical protein
VDDILLLFQHAYPFCICSNLLFSRNSKPKHKVSKLFLFKSKKFYFIELFPRLLIAFQSTIQIVDQKSRKIMPTIMVSTILVQTTSCPFISRNFEDFSVFDSSNVNTLNISNMVIDKIAEGKINRRINRKSNISATMDGLKFLY